MQCGCGQRWEWTEVEEIDETTSLGIGACPVCGIRLGVEGSAKEIDPLLSKILWTDEAEHFLERLPPYVALLVREEVEEYAQGKGVKLITFALLTESKNRGTVFWGPEAERRLERIPAAVQAMARIELERTAVDRGMSEVTVALMEEVKARYFGMGGAQP
ncbi:MAG: PCP reductase family protein [Nitrospirales bacterium]|nr:PCP reductase family protein [Nitrospirales bacterium]